MTCQECELLLAQDEATAEATAHLAGCAECRGLAAELRSNTEALFSMRGEVVPERRRLNIWKWVPAVAAALVCGVGVWNVWHPGVVRVPDIHVTAVAQPAVEPVMPPVAVARTPWSASVTDRGGTRTSRAGVGARPTPKPAEPLLVKMLTPDPDVVIYWLIESKGEKI